MRGILAMRPHGLTHELPRTEYMLVKGEPDCRWLIEGESYCSFAFWLALADA